MAKDEDVCLHCGLCAERCPTGAWDMQKFLLDMTQRRPAAAATNAQRESRAEDANEADRRPANDFVVKFANVNGSGSASANGLFARGHPAHGRAGRAAQHLPVEHPGPADVVRGARHRERLARPPRRRRPDGRDESADLGQGRRRDRARRLPLLRLDQAAAAVEVPRRRQRDRHAAHRDLQREYTDPRQRQLFKNIIYVGALSALLDIDPNEIERLFAEQYKGKEALLESNVKALRLGRDYAREHFELPDRAQGQARRQRSASGSSSTATAPRRSAPCTAARRCARGIRSRRRRRSPKRSSSTAGSTAPIPPPARTRYAIVQAEDELASIGMVIGASWNGARAFTATSGPAFR